MFSFLSKIILKIWGWKITNAIPPGVKKCVVIVAPHTSMIDFVVGRLAYGVIGVKPKILIKKESFFWPIGGPLKALGGHPVDRGKSNNLVDQVADSFNGKDSWYVVITPEGTRKPRTKWKRGFYHIALKADVPVALGYIDYGNKTGGIGKVFYPTGDIEKDMIEIKSFYKGMTARHPEMFVTGLE